MENRLNIRINEELKSTMSEVAKSLDMDLSEFVREAIRTRLLIAKYADSQAELKIQTGEDSQTSIIIPIKKSDKTQELLKIKGY